jgi:hypothetical protein
MEIMDGNNKQEALKVLKGSGHLLRIFSEELINDKEVVMTAVCDHGAALAYASKELQNDREVVVAAVSNSGWSLEYASEQLQNDKELLLLLERESKEDVIEYLKDWYEERMAVLKSYKEQEIMEKNLNEAIISKLKIKKF